MNVVQNWIGALVDPEHTPNSPNGLDVDNVAAKRLRNDQMGTSPPSFTSYISVPPPPPMIAPPPLPNNPLAPAQPQAAFLPLFNQTANQRKMSVDYPAQFTGPAHAGVWTVQCIGTTILILVSSYLANHYNQLMVFQRVQVRVQASNLPRKKLLSRHIMLWDGLLVRRIILNIAAFIRLIIPLDA